MFYVFCALFWSKWNLLLIELELTHHFPQKPVKDVWKMSLVQDFDIYEMIRMSDIFYNLPMDADGVCINLTWITHMDASHE